MYESFTDRARKAMQYAKVAAHEYKLSAISPLMICMGVLKAWPQDNQFQEPLYCALEKLGLDKQSLITDFRKQLGERRGNAEIEQLPLDASAHQVVADATRAAQCVNECTDNKHLFFTLMKCRDRALDAFFKKHALTEERIRNAMPAQEKPGSK